MGETWDRPPVAAAGRRLRGILRCKGTAAVKVVFVSRGWVAIAAHYERELGTLPCYPHRCDRCRRKVPAKIEGYACVLERPTLREVTVGLTLHTMVDLLGLARPETGLAGLEVTLQRVQNHSNGRVAAFDAKPVRLPPGTASWDPLPDVRRAMGYPDPAPFRFVADVLDAWPYEQEGGGQ